MELGGWPDMWVNTAATAPGESKEVSQEDMVRVSESMKQAALVGWQIKGDQQKNNQVAKFLEFLFSAVKSDSIWELVVELCSKTDSTGQSMTLAIDELVVFFAPFFPHQVQEHGIHIVFPHIPSSMVNSLQTYIQYIRDVRGYYPLIQQMSADALSALIVALAEYFDYGVIHEWKTREQMVELVMQQLA